jgi:anti-anti-sigma regulatory factor
MESVLEPSERMPVLSVELLSTGSLCRLVLRGELCDITLAALEAQVDQLGCMPCQDVVVDLRSVVRLDAVGANVLLGLYHYVIARGGTFGVTEAPEEVAAVLQAATGTLIPRYGDSPSASL